MRKSDILEILWRRIAEQTQIMLTYQRGSAYDRAAAAKHELLDMLIEVEKIGRKKRTP